MYNFKYFIFINYLKLVFYWKPTAPCEIPTVP